MNNAIRELEKQFYDFDIIQLIKIITEILDNDGNAQIYFESEPSFAFPPNDIGRVKITDNRATVCLPIMNLLGISTPLPITLSDHINCNRPGADVLRDFLSIMQNRLHALWIEAQRVDLFEVDVFSYRTINTPAKTASGLKQLLESTWNGTPVRITENIGQWTSAENMHGLGDNLRLGCDSVLGSKIFDRTAKFRISLGPLDYNMYNSFLPDGDNHNLLTNIVTPYLDQSLICELELMCRPDELIPAQIGGNIGCIGRTAILGEAARVGNVCGYYIDMPVGNNTK